MHRRSNITKWRKLIPHLDVGFIGLTMLYMRKIAVLLKRRPWLFPAREIQREQRG